MSVRQLVYLALASAVVMVLGMLVLDAPIARAFGDVTGSPLDHALARVLDVTDRVVLLLWPPKEWLAIGLVVVGAIAWRVHTRLGATLVLMGLTHAVSRTFGGHLKTGLGRLRPSEALARGHLDDSWAWDDGFAFPSGHVAHYGAIACALCLAVPRARVPALIVLGMIACARVIVDAHWLSDVAGAVAIAAGAAALFGAMLTRLGAPWSAWR